MLKLRRGTTGFVVENLAAIRLGLASGTIQQGDEVLDELRGRWVPVWMVLGGASVPPPASSPMQQPGFPSAALGAVPAVAPPTPQPLPSPSVSAPPVWPPAVSGSYAPPGPLQAGTAIAPAVPPAPRRPRRWALGLTTAGVLLVGLGGWVGLALARLVPSSTTNADGLSTSASTDPGDAGASSPSVTPASRPDGQGHVVITATAEDLCLEFEHDQATAGAKYKGATVEVEGLVAVAAEGLGGGAVVALLGPAKIRADEGWIALPENAVSGVDRSGETTWTFTDPVTGERVVATQREIRIGDCIVALVFPAEEAQDLAELAPGTNDFRARCSWAEYGYFAPLQARVVRLVGCKHQL